MKLSSLLVAGSLLSLFSPSARGELHPAPLTPLPDDKLAQLAPLLRERDLALIEAEKNGALKQTTTITLVAAPPELVREVVVHPERYGEFVRNLTKSHVTVEPGGTLLHRYVINYHVYTVDGAHRYVMLPKRPGDVAAPVEMFDPIGDGKRHYRWEFLPAGGATVMVLYGYANIPRDGFSSRYLRKAPTLEYGFALIPQLTLLRSMKARAEKLAQGSVVPPTGKAGSWDFLLERGTLAVLHCAGERLVDLSLIERSTARPETIVKVAADVAGYHGFVPTVDRSRPLGEKDGIFGASTEQSLPLMNWSTSWAYRVSSTAVDLFGLDGDLRGARLRWDARPLADGRSEVVLRAMEDFQNGSLLLREVYKLEPYLEYGFDVALNLLLLQSVRHRAEALSAAVSSAPAAPARAGRTTADAASGAR